MTSRERKALRAAISTGIKCIIDIGRAIKRGDDDRLAQAVANLYADQFIVIADEIAQAGDEASGPRYVDPERKL